MSRFKEIQFSLEEVKSRIEAAAISSDRNPADITLIAVTKRFPVSDAQILYELGIRDMGENRDDEGKLKSEQLPSDIRWHFQGQVQSRKIKSISSWADVVHSLDSISHAHKFEASDETKSSEFFVQVNLEVEREDRGGVPVAELESFLAEIDGTTQLHPIGLMTVAPIGIDPMSAFQEVKRLQENFLTKYPLLTQFSMGMSGDFEAAIKAGATHIRVGSSILGSREYPA